MIMTVIVTQHPVVSRTTCYLKNGFPQLLSCKKSFQRLTEKNFNCSVDKCFQVNSDDILSLKAPYFSQNLINSVNGATSSRILIQSRCLAVIFF